MSTTRKAVFNGMLSIPGNSLNDIHKFPAAFEPRNHAFTSPIALPILTAGKPNQPNERVYENQTCR